MPIIFNKSLTAWSKPEFELTFKQELRDLDTAILPLQAALSQSNQVSDIAIDPVILRSSETESAIQIRVGIFYIGVIAGSCCADDPTPMCEQLEYCEILCVIDKVTAAVSFTLLP